MGTSVNIGGERLGAGGKMKVSLHGYERSTHDLGHVVRTTMAAGVLTPFLTELALPGDTWDINLDVDVKTHPTIGPMFGSEKIQLDIFLCPIRLYHASLMQNQTGVGKDIKSIKLPQIELSGFPITNAQVKDNAQINPSSLLAHLGIMGIGVPEVISQVPIRQFNGLPYLMYWDIYKVYYANKQEEIGAFIHKTLTTVWKNITTIQLFANNGGAGATIPFGVTTGTLYIYPEDTVVVTYTANATDSDHIMFSVSALGSSNIYDISARDLFEGYTQTSATVRTYWGLKNYQRAVIRGWRYVNERDVQTPVAITTFPLANIDTMKDRILQQPKATALVINAATNLSPYHLPLTKSGTYAAAMQNLEGLALKTYQADVNNNWMNASWVDGTNGLNEMSAVSVVSGKFTMDQLNLAKKVYEMLSRIMISGGTYEDYLETVYDHKQVRKLTSPMYMGGLSKELMFQEVIANSAAEDGQQPLGQLAGRGVLGKKHKGGRMHIKVDEPSYIFGIISITPRVDYSQGNDWDMNLKTLDDLHKPALDQIGYQDLITDPMAWWDTRIQSDNSITFRSAGKQPAWINYMTNVNKVKGNFAIRDNEGFMVFTRDYEGQSAARISDLTTYVDPTKCNYIFADTALDAQNYWVNIGIEAEVRRKMSAKMMPNI